MNASREIEVTGARLRCRDEGAGPGLVFVHGWTLDLDVWEPQAPLAAEMRVVRYDRRGFGLSDGEPSLAQDVADLGAVLTTLGITRPLLVGMSQGARVVLEFAARHPHVARGLVLDGPPPLLADDADVPLEELRQLAARDGLEAFRRTWHAHPFMQLMNRDARMHALLERILARYPGHDVLAREAPPRESLDQRLLAAIRTPTLIVNGAHDTASRRRAGAALQAALAHAELVLVPDAAHLPNLDAPLEYNRLMSGFAHRHLPAAA